MSEPNAQEPTMEEILASIRRIISEDEPAADSAAAEDAPEAEAEPEPLAAAPAPVAAAPEPVAVAAPAPEPEAEAEDVLELTEVAPEPAPAAAVESLGDLDLYPPADARPKAEPAAAPMRPAEPLVSGSVAASTGAAFGQLAQRLALPKEGRTLEDLVREMLNPLLKAWLDDNLPAIVQAKVEEEVERIARRHV
jgi:cell pole-organizing protein PopZ